jgi:hypothetical protein
MKPRRSNRRSRARRTSTRPSHTGSGEPTRCV